MPMTARAGVLLLGAVLGRLLDISPGQPDAAALTALQHQVAALSERVADGDRRADALMDAVQQRLASLTPNRVVAPFEVVDKAGKTIMAVRAEPRGLVLMDAQGRVVVAASALANGGFIKALSGSGALQTVMGVNGGFAGFVLRQGDKSRGTFAIDEEGKPILNMANDNFITVVALTQGSTGGGLLELGDAAGASTVQAGTTPDGVGLVRAFPLGNPGAGLVGMPGTFILGRKGQ